MILPLLQVMQTLSEAEQVCVELQHSVSGLDTRLAELLHWETEARELYQVLRAAQRQQRGQDPQAKARRALASARSAIYRNVLGNNPKTY